MSSQSECFSSIFPSKRCSGGVGGGGVGVGGSGVTSCFSSVLSNTSTIDGSFGFLSGFAPPLWLDGYSVSQQSVGGFREAPSFTSYGGYGSCGYDDRQTFDFISNSKQMDPLLLPTREEDDFLYPSTPSSSSSLSSSLSSSSPSCSSSSYHSSSSSSCTPSSYSLSTSSGWDSSSSLLNFNFGFESDMMPDGVLHLDVPRCGPDGVLYLTDDRKYVAADSHVEVIHGGRGLNNDPFGEAAEARPYVASDSHPFLVAESDGDIYSSPSYNYLNNDCPPLTPPSLPSSQPLTPSSGSVTSRDVSPLSSSVSSPSCSVSSPLCISPSTPISTHSSPTTLTSPSPLNNLNLTSYLNSFFNPILNNFPPPPLTQRPHITKPSSSSSSFHQLYTPYQSREEYFKSPLREEQLKRYREKKQRRVYHRPVDEKRSATAKCRVRNSRGRFVAH